MSVRNAEFEAMIEAAPDDPQGYFVYADWLESHGDPRGALIAAQRACLEHPDAAVFASRVEEIVERYRAELLGPLHRFKGSRALPGFQWRLGFIERARFHRRSAKPLLSELVRTFLEHPSSRFVRHLTLGPADNARDRPGYGPTIDVLRSLAPKTLRSLHVAEASVDVGDLSGLFEAPLALERMTLSGRKMSLGDRDVTSPSLRELTVILDDYESLSKLLRLGIAFPALTWLRLDLREVSEDEAGHARPDAFPALERLTVHATRGGWDRSERPVKPAAWLWPILPRLRELDLDFRHFGVHAAAHLGLHAKRFRHLRRLRLPMAASLGADARMALEESLGNVEWVDLAFPSPFDAPLF